MITVDERLIRAPIRLCMQVAGDVERWPEILPHYRWVRFLEGDAREGVVEMAAWRPFPIGIRYPTWWVSRMRTEADALRIVYSHVRGITRGMDVSWEFEPAGGSGAGATLARITHAWRGPAWPLIGGVAARLVIGPHFISAIASRTLAGVGAEAERRRTMTDGDRSGARTAEERT